MPSWRLPAARLSGHVIGAVLPHSLYYMHELPLSMASWDDLPYSCHFFVFHSNLNILSKKDPPNASMFLPNREAKPHCFFVPQYKGQRLGSPSKEQSIQNLLKPYMSF
uniref:N-acetyltransferase domain-containing protein n=1 Tax=Panagrellus redivivus TaxID=6233 RepID=A0A7E4W1I6_PANRE